MTKAQKNAIENWMFFYVRSSNGIKASDLITQTVLNFPFANRHHASGILSSLVRKKFRLIYNSGWVY